MFIFQAPHEAFRLLALGFAFVHLQEVHEWARRLSIALELVGVVVLYSKETSQAGESCG